jgi:hypothetical protein
MDGLYLLLPLPMTQMEELYGSPPELYEEAGEPPPGVVVIDLVEDDEDDIIW